MLYILYSLVISYSLGNSSPCSGKVDLFLKLQKDTVYTYQNSISTTKWPRRNEANVTRQTNKFTSMFYPLEKIASGYRTYEVITKAQNNELLDLVTKPAPRLPQIINVPFYPVGQIEGSSGKSNPVQIKEVGCNQVFKIVEEESSDSGDLFFAKTSINKIAGTEEREFKDKDLDLIQIESRRKVTLQGKMEGSGTEKVTIYLVKDTRELFEERKSFRYEYVTGEGDNRHAEIMNGEYRKKLVKKEKYTKLQPTFPEITSKENKVTYYTNANGVFIPVTLNNTIITKMYVSPTASSSYLEHTFFAQNFSNKPKDYFYPVQKLYIGENLVLNPGIEIIKNNASKIDYKIPGLIGKNVISKSVIVLNDKKRTFSLSEPLKTKKKTPQKALLVDIVGGYPLFEMTVNGTITKTTISFDSKEPEISKKLAKQLRLKIIQIAGSENHPERNIMEKAEIIVTPADRPYFKTEAIVKDFADAPYDLKLGLDYIKGKELIINYKYSWMLIQDVK